MALQSEKAVHQFGCSDCGEKRKKVDMKCLGSEGESKYDLRKSLAWDAAFFTSPGFLEPEELFHCSRDGHEKASAAEMKTDNKANNELNSSSRPSLAWDNAFLTSEGVLDPVELCLVNKGLNKSEIHLLPANAIQQLRMSSLSTDSHDGSSSSSSSSSLATLELQLFELSQPHHHDLTKHTHMHNNIHTLKRVDGPTQPKMKSLQNPRKQTANDQSQKISKEAFITIPSSKQFAERSEFNPSSSSSSLKPPKSSGRVKRVSLVTNEVKQDSKQVHFTNGKNWIAPGKPRSPLKCSESESDCHNSSNMKKTAEKSTRACRDHRVRPKGTSFAPPSNNNSDDDPFLLIKPSGIRLPSPQIGFFDEGEESENRPKAPKDKDIITIMKSSKGCYSHQHYCGDKTKDCIRNHKMKPKRPISHKVDNKALLHHRRGQAITTIEDTGDVLMELSTNHQGPQKL